MNTNRKTAIIVGILYIIGTVAGIASLAFTAPILGAPDVLAAVSANPTQLILGALCVLIMGLALAMVPLVMYPILEKINKVLALGYVVFRSALETFTYLALMLSWLFLLPLSQAYAHGGAADAFNFQALGAALLRGNEFALLTAIIFPLGALMFYYLLYQSKLIPRWLSVWGLIGVVPYLAGSFLTMFHLVEPMSTLQTLCYLPIALQEMVMAVWLIVKGFNPSAIASETAPVDVSQYNLAHTWQ